VVRAVQQAVAVDGHQQGGHGAPPVGHLHRNPPAAEARRGTLACRAAQRYLTA
jgi:hypothetical protein